MIKYQLGNEPERTNKNHVEVITTEQYDKLKKPLEKVPHTKVVQGKKVYLSFQIISDEGKIRNKQLETIAFIENELKEVQKTL